MSTAHAYTTFGQRLKTELQDRQLSQARLACEMGISYDLLNCYANGRRIPSYRSILKIMEYLPGVDVTWLVTGQVEEDV